jgi:hypothetical protein
MRFASLLFVLSSLPSLASATEPCMRGCECAQWTRATPQTWPDAYTLAVPTNVRILVSQPFAPDGFVLHSDREEGAIPIDVEPIEGVDAVWVVPQAPLEPSTSYALENDFFAYAIQFTTATGPDEEAPIAPSPSAGTVEDGVACDALVGTDVTMFIDDEVLVEVTVGGGTDARRYLIPGDAFEAGITIGGMTGAMSVCDEDLPDGFVETLPGAEDGARVDIAFRTIDFAGNSSAPVTLSGVLLQAAAPGDTEKYGACCGCRTVGASYGNDGAWLALALLVVRRRRVTTRRSR